MLSEKILKKFSSPLKRIISVFAAATVAASSFCAITADAAFAPSAEVYSDGVYMVNLDTDICVYKKNEFAKCYPASTTKIMTCLLVLEKAPSLDDYVKITYDATDEFWSGDPNKEGPSSAAIEVGQENLTYRDCLYALMLASACEAANVLAYNIGGGSIQTFVDMMNAKATELGCANTHFGNAHGLWQEDNYSCAYDMYLISKYAYDTYPEFMEICNTYDYDMPANSSNPDGYSINTTNRLIKNSAENEFYYEYASGIKTGSIDHYYLADGTTKVGGRSLVSTAMKDGYSYMLVTLNAPYYNEAGEATQYSFIDHLTLYRWAFSTFAYTTVLSKNDRIAQIEVEQGENADHVILQPIADYSTLLPKNLDKSTIQQIVTAEKTMVAPVEKGQVLGSVELKLSGETLTKVDLIAAEGVERSQIAYMTEQIKEIVDTGWFKACVAVLTALVVILIVLIAMRNAKKSKANKNKRIRR